MSPVDLRLIVTGLFRGRPVQFDRSEPERFRCFVEDHSEGFEDLRPAVAELEEKEGQYRASMPDISHHGARLLTDAGLRRSIKEGAITAWLNLGRIDQAHASRLADRHWLFRLLFAISMLPVLGPFLTELWGNGVTREHWKRSLLGPGYLSRALRGSRIETLIRWLRSGRVSGERAHRIVDRPIRYWIERVLVAWLPASWHRFLTDPTHAWARTREAARFTIRFLRVPAFRDEFLCEQVEMGREEGMLTEALWAAIQARDLAPDVPEHVKRVEELLRALRPTGERPPTTAPSASTLR